MFLGISGFMFFTFADQMYKNIAVLGAERDSINSDLEDLRALAKLSDELRIQYNSIPRVDLKRLAKMIPSDIATDQLMVELNQLASLNGLVFQNIDMADDQIPVTGRGRSPDQVAAPLSGLQLPKLSFKVSGTYQGIRLFLEDLESHIRITDVDQIEFQAAQDAEGFIEVGLKGVSYWSK